MNFDFYHLIIYSPVAQADIIRQALSKTGAGKIGNYDSCSFSAKGTGRFRPLKNSKPYLGKKDKIESFAEERIEALAPKNKIKDILKAVTAVHPYEEPAIHVLPMFDYHDFLKREKKNIINKKKK